MGQKLIDVVQYNMVVTAPAHCQRHYVQIILTELNRSRLRNFWNMWVKFHVSFEEKCDFHSLFSQKARLLDNLFWGNPVANFMKFRQIGSWVTD